MARLTDTGANIARRNILSDVVKGVVNGVVFRYDYDTDGLRNVCSGAAALKDING